MGTYHASSTPSGDGVSTLGTESSTWSLARAFQTIDGTPGPGDRVVLHAGNYAGPFGFTASGDPGNPIVYAAAGDGVVTIDSSRLAVSSGSPTVLATESGWSLVNGMGVLGYPDGGNSGAVGMVYRKTGVYQTVLGVLVDPPTTGDWRWQSLWDMRTQNPNGTNPQFRIHDADINHNDFQAWEDGTLRQVHDWKGQFRQNLDGYYGPVDSIDIRIFDSTDPNTHNIYLVLASDALFLGNQHDLIFDGGVDQQLVFQNASGLVHLLNCNQIQLKNLKLTGSGAGHALQLEQCLNCHVEGVRVLGAGSAGARAGSGIRVVNSSSVSLIKNEVAYASEHGIHLVGCQNITAWNNNVHDSGGGIVIEGGGSVSLEIDENTITDVGTLATQLNDAAPQGGITILEQGNGYIRRNKISGTGMGIVYGASGSTTISPSAGMHVYNNDIYGCSQDGIHIEQTSSSQVGQFANNVLQNNIAFNCGRYDLYVALWNGASNNWFGNAIRYNDFGDNTAYLVSLGDNLVNLGATNLRTAASQASTLIQSGNIVSDPLLTNPAAGDFSIPSNSPCVDNGRRTIDSAGTLLNGSSTDIGIGGTERDMGWFEYGVGGGGGGGGGTPKPIGSVTASAAGGAAPFAVSLTFTASESGGTIQYGTIDYGDGQTETVGTPPNPGPLPVGVPNPPAGLTASPGNTQVSLSWNASSGAASYNVKRSTTSGSGYVTAGSGVTATTYTMTGLVNGTTYYFVVSAVNTAGESANSTQASASPSSGVVPTIPPTPTGLTAAAGNAQVSLTWNASSGATGYNLKRSTTSGTGYTTIVANSASASYTNTGLTNGTTYYYVVSALNSAGESANSSQVSAAPSSGSGGEYDALLTAINSYRVSNGVQALQHESHLDGSAQPFAVHLATDWPFSHTGADGSTPFTRITGAGFTGGIMGENIAIGFADVSSVMTAWINSPGHQANLVYGPYQYVGVGIANGPQGKAWVNDFGGFTQGSSVLDVPSSFTRSHTYTAAGTYKVTWTLYDTNGVQNDPPSPNVTITVTSGGIVPLGGKIALPANLITASNSDTTNSHTPDKVSDCFSQLENVCDSTQPTNANGFWQTDAATNPASNFPHYLKIPLSATGTQYQLTKFRLSPTRWYTGRTYTLSLYTSQADRAFTDAGWIPLFANQTTNASASADPTKEWTEWTINAVQAGYVLVKWLSNSETVDPGMRAAGCWELEAYGNLVSNPPVVVAPTATLTAIPNSGTSPLTVAFRCESTHDPNRTVGSGTLIYDATAPQNQQTFTNPGSPLSPSPTNTYTAPPSGGTPTPSVSGPFGNVRVTVDTDPHNDRSENAATVNPTNPLNLVTSSKKFTDPATYAHILAAQYSVDGGLTWAESGALGLPGGTVHNTDPALAFDNLGNCFLVGLPEAQGTSTDQAGAVLGIVLWKSTNGGVTWGSPNVIHTSSGDDKEWITSDITPTSPYVGRTYVVWDDGSAQRFARTLDHGATWIGLGSNVAGTLITSGYSDPSITVDGQGIIHIVAISGGSLGYLRSTDGGQSFSAATSIVTGLTNLSSVGLPAPDGFAELPGGRFRVVTLPGTTGFGNTLLVTWADYREGASRIYYRRSLDNGLTWQGSPSGQPLLTGAILPTQIGAQDFHPQVVGNTQGVVGCAFYELANFSGTYKINTFLALSFDGGVTFTRKVTLTDQPWDPAVDAPLSHGSTNTTFIGEYFGLCESQGTFTTVWTDTRTGIQELYCDRVRASMTTSGSVYTAQWQVTDSGGTKSNLAQVTITVNGSSIQPPLAGVTAVPSSGTDSGSGVPIALNFTFSDPNNPGGSITKIVIDYGDSTNETINNPTSPLTRSHTYRNSGTTPLTFTIGSTVTNAGNASVTASTPVVINPKPSPPPHQKPVATITATPSNGTGPFTTTFALGYSTSDGATITTGTLSYGDGTSNRVISTPANPVSPAATHQYALVSVDATYTASWVVTDSTGAQSDPATFRITDAHGTPVPPHQNPTAGIAAGPTTGPAPLIVNFTLASAATGATVTSGTLSYGDGTSPQTFPNPVSPLSVSHTFQTAGTYSVTWQVTDSLSATGSATPQTIQVDPAPLPPPPAPPGSDGTTDIDGNTGRYSMLKTIDGKTAPSGDPFARWSVELIDLVTKQPRTVWGRIQYASVGPIGRVRIYFFQPHNRSTTYNLGLSLNKEGPWTWVAQNHTSAAAEYTEERFTPLSAQYLRIEITKVVEGGNNLAYASIFEIQSFPS